MFKIIIFIAVLSFLGCKRADLVGSAGTTENSQGISTGDVPPTSIPSTDINSPVVVGIGEPDASPGFGDQAPLEFPDEPIPTPTPTPIATTVPPTTTTGSGIHPPTTVTGGSFKPLHINRICRPLNSPRRNIGGVNVRVFHPTTGAAISFNSSASSTEILSSILSSQKKMPDHTFNTLADGRYFVLLCNSSISSCIPPIKPIPQITAQFDLYRRDLVPTRNEPLDLMEDIATNSASDPRIGAIPILEIRDGKPFLPAKAGFTSSGIKSRVSEVGVIFDPDPSATLFGGNCVHSPLIANFAEEDIKLSAPSNGVMFDISAKGVKNKISWPTKSKTGFLVHDLNKNNQIDNSEELFGNLTRLPNGEFAKNGFEALKPYDSNSDGFVTKEDKNFSELRFWFDKDRNGLSNGNELMTLDELSIVRLITEYSVEEKKDEHGNVFREFSLMENSKGRYIPIYDVWLLKD